MESMVTQDTQIQYITWRQQLETSKSISHSPEQTINKLNRFSNQTNLNQPDNLSTKS